MSEATEQQNLQGLSIRERHQVKEPFFRLYRKTGNVAESARALDICRRTATRWVKAYKGNGNRVRHEGRHGRRTGEGRVLTREQERKLMSMLVDKTPMQYKFPFALWNSRAIRDLIRAEFGVEKSAEQAEHWLTRASALGDAEAECLMGELLEEGELLAKDDKAAADWYAKAAEKNHARALFNLGVLYAEGRGVPRNGNKAAKLYHRSAVLRYAPAQFNLGALFAAGDGVPKDMAKAVAHDSAAGKVVLIVDNLRVHHAKLVRAWAARHRDEIKIFYLPAYSPELNPDELVDSDLKIGIGQREPAKDRRELERQVCEHMDGVKANPEKVAAFFKNRV